MKHTTTTLPLLFSLLPTTLAFPAGLQDSLLKAFAEKHSSDHDVRAAAAAAGCPMAAMAGRSADADAEAEPASCPFAKMKRQLPGVTPPFDAELQYVSNTGDHAFVAPGSGDQRGPCPGLNALANHGYLPHNGVGTIQEFITGTTEGFGMGADLATFLAIYGAVMDGNLLSYSIGGPAPSLLGGLLDGLLEQPQGLSGSHNNYESDVSPTRGDLYEYGNDYLLQMSQFKALYELQQGNSNSLDIDLLTTFRATRFQQSIDNNPYFFNAPVSGLIVQPAAYTFMYRFMANKSAEYPMGLLDGETLKSFYSITGDYPDFTYTPGYEKIPDNWYKRNPVDYYTIPYYALDLNTMALEHPEFLSVGGNLGETDTFTGIDPADLTGGVYNADMLLEGNNAICYATQLALMAAPTILQGLFADVETALGKLTSAIDDATGSLDCAKLNEIDTSQFDQFPGYTKLGSDGTY